MYASRIISDLLYRKGSKLIYMNLYEKKTTQKITSIMMICYIFIHYEK